MHEDKKHHPLGKCTRCNKWAEIKISYPFCADCFTIHYEKRVTHLIKSKQLIKRDDRVLVAVSGGKDSLSAAHALSKLRTVFNFHLGVLHIDVGILECTNERSELVVSEFCKARNLPFHFVRFKDYLGAEIKEVCTRTRRKECSICATFKRHVFNRFARENNYNKLATGHCADDITRFFFKNWFSGQFAWISKFKPITPSNHPKVVTRIRPLFETLEAENMAYTKVNNLVVCGCSRCSYFLRKDVWNDCLRAIDAAQRDFKVQFVRGLEVVEIKAKEPPQRRLNECQRCGEPTDSEICTTCRIKG